MKMELQIKQEIPTWQQNENIGINTSRNDYFGLHIKYCQGKY